MILGAALLVLLGLGLFVAGLSTGIDVLYWLCVAACVAAAVLLVLARRTIAARESAQKKALASAQVPVAAGAPTATPAAAAEPVAAAPEVPLEQADPPVEEVEVTDLLLVVDLTDEVLVVDEHPRYHVAGCSWVGSRDTIPLPLNEARTDGFTPCGTCRPDRTLAGRARAARNGA
ncbi:hypothetical protein DQ237_14010 [Blastococcus sp. TF02-8]|uniref:hypothetical protein n=1 Tax=Blastococcus sp. TF02-8 TaxID=2250574 RepID=UPI000DE8CD00|nr:hypothetical protein [Blastococcus sp. TF02-8]RBY95629.1 hypothetical protein DQ237_14010 [Blastococcus sp. TF02-8]